MRLHVITQPVRGYVIWIHLGRVVHNLMQGPNQRRVAPSCVCLIYFLHNSTEYHVMRAECQRVLISLLLNISHKSPAIAKRCHLLIFLILVFYHSPITPLSLPYFSPITPWSNSASFYPLIIDNLEWMDMQTGLTLSVMLNMFCSTSSFPQRLKNQTLHKI